MSGDPQVLERTRTRPDRCPACGLRGWRLDLDERCEHCNPCCEEHFPSEADTPEEQAQHICPACSWEANPWWWDEKDAQGGTSVTQSARFDECGEPSNDGDQCDLKGKLPHGGNMHSALRDGRRIWWTRDGEVQKFGDPTRG